jgi:hypothetical protein
VTQRLRWIERVSKAVPAGGLRHELSDAGGTFWAYGAGIETAFLPDHAGKKFDR